MSIRLRLILSYLAMLIIPMILLFLSFIITIIVFFGSFQELKTNIWDGNSQMGKPDFTQTNETITELKTLAIYLPEQLQNRDYWKQLDTKLKATKQGLIVINQHQIHHISPSLKGMGLEKAFSANYQAKENKNTSEYEIKIQDNYFTYQRFDSRKVSFFIVKDSSIPNSLFQQISWIIPVALFLALAISNGLLTYLVSKSIIRPLRALKIATEEIKNGNLDYEVKPMSKDEIGELSLAFEQMRRKLKESVELQLRYEENRKELVSNISHDLKTPMTAILGYIQGILDGVANSPEKLEKYLSVIFKKATDMDRLIDELFLFSKLDLNHVSFHFEEVEIHHYLQNCLEELQCDVDSHQISLSYHKEGEESVYVKADREKLKRVIFNVVDNSTKYMDKGKGEIKISTHYDKEYVTIGIQDNGPGISPESLPYIFDRFYRADLSRNTQTGGSGLGLAIAKHLIEEHDGDIWAESTLHQGTLITLQLKRIRNS
jgi:histidine kinase